MDKRIFDFVNKNRISVLSTVLPSGTPHSAALHYSSSNEPFKIFFSTDKTSRKCQDLLDGKTGKASVVIGFDENEMVTLQGEGEVQAIFDKQELLEAQKVHYKKYPDSEKWKDDQDSIFLVFIPTWWRYTEFKPKFFTIESK